MAIRRFFCDGIPVEGGEVVLDGEESRHIVKVLRLKVGDELDLLDGVGVLARAVVAGVSGGGRQARVICRVCSRSQAIPPALKIHLYVAPPRAKLMGSVIRQATELGVWQITPVICDYSVARPGGEAADKNWRAEALAAVKQSGNRFLPTFGSPCSFDAVLQDMPKHGIFGDLESTSSAEVRAALPSSGSLALWIGPEGGFSEREREALIKHGMLPVRLGQWILRVETAVPAMLGWLWGVTEGANVG